MALFHFLEKLHTNGPKWKIYSPGNCSFAELKGGEHPPRNRNVVSVVNRGRRVQPGRDLCNFYQHGHRKLVYGHVGVMLGSLFFGIMFGESKDATVDANRLNWNDSNISRRILQINPTKWKIYFCVSNKCNTSLIRRVAA